jgi:hypothetical protein
MGRVAPVGDGVVSPENCRVLGVNELVVEGLRGSLVSSVAGAFDVEPAALLLDG